MRKKKKLKVGKRVGVMAVFIESHKQPPITSCSPDLAPYLAKRSFSLLEPPVSSSNLTKQKENTVNRAAQDIQT